MTTWLSSCRSRRPLTFVVTGEVSFTPVLQGYTPDGTASTPHTTGVGGVENGIGNVIAPAVALIGVFLDATQPSLAGPAPGTLDFSAPASQAYPTLSPVLRQPFFIGDGLTGTGTGTQQVINIPMGATRLFLGTMDGFGWYDNAGQYQVTVTQVPAAAAAPTAAVPTLSQWGIVLLAGLLGIVAIVVLRRQAN